MHAAFLLNGVVAMKDRLRSARGMLCTCGAALLYGSLPVYANFAYAAGANAETFNLHKSAFALPVLAVVLLIRRKRILLPRTQLLFAVLAGVLGKGITSLLLYTSYNYVDGGVATTLHFMYPLFSVLLVRFVFHTRVPVYRWLVLALATGGVALFVDPAAGGGQLVGVICAVASGAVYAVYILLVDKSGLSALDPMVFAFYLALSGSVFSALYGAATGTLLFSLPARAYLYMAMAAVMTSVAAAALFQQGIRLLGGASAAFFSLLEPVGSCVFGALFLSEQMGIRSAAGVAVILSALVLMTFFDQRGETKRGKDGRERRKS